MATPETGRRHGAAPALPPHEHRTALLPFLALGILGAALYMPHAGAFYNLDDFELLFANPRGTHWDAFFRSTPPLNGYWRPIQNTVLLAVQTHAGFATAPIHAIQLAMHVLLATLAGALLRRMGFSRIQSGIAAVYVLVSQSAVIAVLSNDTMSQVGATLFGLASLGAAWAWASAPSSPPSLRLLAIGSFAIALLFKECAVAVLPQALLVLWLARSRRGGRSLGWLGAGYVATTGAYLAVRAAIATVQPSFGPNGALQLGPNVPKGVAMLLFSSIVPGSSVEVYMAAVTRHWVPFAALVAAALFVAAVATKSLVRDRPRWGTYAALGALSVLAVLPVSLMRHVSELYAYSALPFVGALLGAAGGRLLGSVHGGWRGAAVVATLAALLALHCQAVLSKGAAMQAAGERARGILTSVAARAQPPEITNVVLVHEARGPEYSVFVWNGFNGVRRAEVALRSLAGRDDLSLRVVDAPELPLALAATAGTLVIRSGEFEASP